MTSKWLSATALLAAACASCTLASCAVAGSAATGGVVGSAAVVRVTAAENFWGSIARQLGGRHAHVVSIIASPSADPHSYEPTAADARTIASSRLVIENGVGYDPWMARLLGADQGERISVINVGGALRVPAGGNPHRWYNPANVRAIIARITADYARADPADRGYFERRKAWFIHVRLQHYYSLIASIKARFGGTPVGASESIFANLAPALGLRLLTPASFLKAITEGTDVSAADKETIGNQIRHHLIKIYVYNSQNVTPDVQAQVAAAKAAGIPVARITETLTPSTATYQAWQAGELKGIAAALARAAG